jgi:hypothetical protein
VIERLKASAQKMESARASEQHRTEAEEFLRQTKREASRAANERRRMEVDCAAMPVLTEENIALRAQLLEERRGRRWNTKID